MEHDFLKNIILKRLIKNMAKNLTENVGDKDLRSNFQSVNWFCYWIWNKTFSINENLRCWILAINISKWCKKCSILQRFHYFFFSVPHQFRHFRWFYLFFTLLQISKFCKEKPLKRTNKQKSQLNTFYDAVTIIKRQNFDASFEFPSDGCQSCTRRTNLEQTCDKVPQTEVKNKWMIQIKKCLLTTYFESIVFPTWCTTSSLKITFCLLHFKSARIIY